MLRVTTPANWCIVILTHNLKAQNKRVFNDIVSHRQLQYMKLSISNYVLVGWQPVRHYEVVSSLSKEI